MFSGIGEAHFGTLHCALTKNKGQNSGKGLIFETRMFPVRGFSEGIGVVKALPNYSNANLPDSMNFC